MFRRSLSRWASYTASDIKQKLMASAALQPVSHVDVQDASSGCGSFFRIDIASDVFAGKSLIQQHRLVNDVLREEIKDIHGFTLNTSVTGPKK